MKDFSDYLEATGEVGTVEQVLPSICYVVGLPTCRPYEVVMFESGEIGQVISMNPQYVEVLLLSKASIKGGTRVTRTDRKMEVMVSDAILGRVVDPLGKTIIGSPMPRTKAEPRLLFTTPGGIGGRRNVSEPLETGVGIVDLTVPLGRGQRELVIGDRKSGKTLFLQQAVLTQALKGGICIYASIAKRWSDTQTTLSFFKKFGVEKKVVTVVAGPADTPGLIFLAPYTALTYAEYFRDKGQDVLLVLDDMTTHAKYYREITLSARRFPGRGSYPGDIFYVHSRILERAGKFAKGSISCLPVAETTFRDFSGYIQTNLMSMTDGHIFFDGDLFARGRRPAINTFLSVTRVGLQTQTNLVREINRELSKFLVIYEKLSQYMHFGSELSQDTKRTLSVGERITSFFEQSGDAIIPLNVNILLLGGVWAGLWRNTEIPQMKKEMYQRIDLYIRDSRYRGAVDKFIEATETFSELIFNLKEDNTILFGKAGAR
jgi:F-type H+-transporting ATPase subunit alpha